MSTVIITDSTTLRELNVSHNDIGDKGISVITEGLQSNKILTNLLVSIRYIALLPGKYLDIAWERGQNPDIVQEGGFQ